MKFFLTAATAIALFTAPALAQDSAATGVTPEIVPGAEINDDDSDDVTGGAGVQTLGTTTTRGGATTSSGTTTVDNAGQSNVVPGVDNNNSDVIIQGQNDPVTQGDAVDGLTTSSTTPDTGPEQADGGSIGVAAGDADAGQESNTPSAGIVPGQDPE